MKILPLLIAFGLMLTAQTLSAATGIDVGTEFGSPVTGSTDRVINGSTIQRGSFPPL